MLFLKTPNRPFLTALLKALVVALILFIGMRSGRFFIQSVVAEYLIVDIKYSVSSGFLTAIVMLIFYLIEKNSISMFGKVMNLLR